MKQQVMMAAVDDLRRRSSRWQTLLNDGVTDLTNDIDFDVRDRARVVAREAEAIIDAQDPGPMWQEIAGWLDERMAEAMADSYVWAEQRSQWLAARVVAVADAFDAITTNRPYQAAHPSEYAVKIIRNLSKNKFDVNVVAALERVFERGDLNVRRAGVVEEQAAAAVAGRGAWNVQRGVASKVQAFATPGLRMRRTKASSSQ